MRLRQLTSASFHWSPRPEVPRRQRVGAAVRGGSLRAAAMTRYMSACSVCSPRTIPRSSSSPRKKIACWCRRIRISGRCSRFGKRPVRLSSSFAACRTAALPLSCRCCWRTSHLSRLTLKLAPWWSSSRTASECADFQCSLEASVASVRVPASSDGAERPDAPPLAKADRCLLHVGRRSFATRRPAARRSGMAAKTIRFYEEVGLIAPRTGNGYPRVRRRRHAVLPVHPPRPRRGVQHRRGPNDLALSVP